MKQFGTARREQFRETSERRHILALLPAGPEDAPIHRGPRDRIEKRCLSRARCAHDGLYRGAAAVCLPQLGSQGLRLAVASGRIRKLLLALKLAQD